MILFFDFILIITIFVFFKNDIWAPIWIVLIGLRMFYFSLKNFDWSRYWVNLSISVTIVILWWLILTWFCFNAELTWINVFIYIGIFYKIFVIALWNYRILIILNTININIVSSLKRTFRLACLPYYSILV